MFKYLLIWVLPFVIAHSAFSNSNDATQELEEFLDQTDIKFMSESDAEEFNFLTMVVDEKLSIKADLGAVAKASSVLRNAVSTDIGREKEVQDKQDNKSYQLKLTQLSYNSNAVKLLRLIVKKEFVPYREDTIKNHPDIMADLLSIMESYGIDGLAYEIASACKTDYFSPSSAKFAELLLHSSPNSLIINSLMEYVCWNSLSKSPANTSPDSSTEDLFKNFILTQFSYLCRDFSFFQLGLKAFSFEVRTDTLVRKIVNRYRWIDWGESEDLSLTSEEISFIKYVVANNCSYNSSSYNNPVSLEGARPRFAMTESQSESFASSEMDLDENSPKELIFLDKLKTKFSEIGFSISLRYSHGASQRSYNYIEIKNGNS